MNGTWATSSPLSASPLGFQADDIASTAAHFVILNDRDHFVGRGSVRRRAMTMNKVMSLNRQFHLVAGELSERAFQRCLVAAGWPPEVMDIGCPF